VRARAAAGRRRGGGRGARGAAAARARPPARPAAAPPGPPPQPPQPPPRCQTLPAAPAGLPTPRIRDLNDEINKLIREKGHWERRIVQLGGPDYAKTAPKITDSEGNVLEGASGRGPGYRYFGAAKNLPGVKELFEKEAPKLVRRTRFQMHKSITPDYYGFRDEEDGLLLRVEAGAEKVITAQVGGVGRGLWAGRAPRRGPAAGVGPGPMAEVQAASASARIPIQCDSDRGHALPGGPGLIGDRGPPSCAPPARPPAPCRSSRSGRSGRRSATPHSPASAAPRRTASSSSSSSSGVAGSSGAVAQRTTRGRSLWRTCRCPTRRPLSSGCWRKRWAGGRGRDESWRQKAV
jgi:hypothetical protein